MLRVIGVDSYNQTTTGDVAKPLTSAASDSDHLPLIIMEVDDDNSFSRVRQAASDLSD